MGLGRIGAAVLLGQNAQHGQRAALPEAFDAYGAIANLPRLAGQLLAQFLVAEGPLQLDLARVLRRHAAWAELIYQQGTVGRPSPMVQVRIVDPDGNEVAPGETGEIVARGPTVMNGYFGRPDETAGRP